MAELGPNAGHPPPGWYHDITRTARWRYWDGGAWTPWIADGITATQDANGAPDLPPPVPMSHAMGRHPPNPLSEETVPAHIQPTVAKPEAEVHLPPWHLGEQPGAPQDDPEPAYWLIAALFGGLIALIGAVTSENAPPFSDGSASMPASTFLGPLMIFIGLVAFVIGALGFASAVATRIHNRNRRNRRNRQRP